MYLLLFGQILCPYGVEMDGPKSKASKGSSDRVTSVTGVLTIESSQ